MYRYSVDNAVTYTPSDLLLFRESPFAIWMERLTLENPEHGIPPDYNGRAPQDKSAPQSEIIDTLREEGRDVVEIDNERPEAARRADTLDAMRNGADFVASGALALGPLCAEPHLLMRTSGYSDFGDFLYIPCDTRVQNRLTSAFRLCFIADLLHSLQGQLPPQMLVISAEADVLPMQTEDHIHYYRAVKKRFMEAMRDFRKHRMPDPSESAHFGRWSECASEVLKQRARGAEMQEATAFLDDELESEDFEDFQRAEEPVLSAVGQSARSVGAAGGSTAAASAAMDAVPTLAEQARMLSPNTYRARSGPGQTPNLARFPRLVEEAKERTEEHTEENTEEHDAEPVGRDDVAQKGSIGVPERRAVERSAPPESLGGPAAEEIGDGSAQAVGRQTSSAADAPREAGSEQGQNSGGTAEAVQRTTAERDSPRGSVVSSEDEVPAHVAAGSQTEVRVATSERGPLMPLDLPTTTLDPLENLAFIGSSAPAAQPEEPPVDASDFLFTTPDGTRKPPPPTLREIPEPHIEGYDVELIQIDDYEEAMREPLREPLLLSPDGKDLFAAPGPGVDTQQFDESMVDLDSAPPPTLQPLSGKLPERTAPDSEAVDTKRRESRKVRDAVDDQEDEKDSTEQSASRTLHSSLITNRDFDPAD